MRIVIASAALAGAAIASAAVALTPHHAHAQTLDRYGGSTADAPAPSSPYPMPADAPPRRAGPAYAAAYSPQVAAAAGLRTLTWPGKDTPTPVYAAQPQPAPLQPYAPGIRFAPPPGTNARMAAGAALPATGGVQSAPMVLRPVPVQAAGDGVQPPSTAYAYVPTPARSPAPTSIYSDAPASAVPGPSAYQQPQAQRPTRMSASAAPSIQVAAAGQPMTPAQMADRLPPPDPNRSRLYSLHREYGMTPDPAPIPPAFFGPTADLSTPETPDLPPRTGATASKAAQNAARFAAEATTQ